jgi:hypothetical protein
MAKYHELVSIATQMKGALASLDLEGAIAISLDAESGRRLEKAIAGLAAVSSHQEFMHTWTVGETGVSFTWPAPETTPDKA